ncbi:MAG: META domain-containing protein [Dehalococcoidales bacterium]
MDKVKFYAIIAVIGAAAFLVAGCTEGDPPPESLPGFPEAGDFENLTWSLESYGEPGNLKSVLADTEITAIFTSQDGQVRGNAGANNYFGGYRLSGTRLTIPQLASTEMFRLDPEGVMDQESAYLKALAAAETYQVRNSKLEISGGGQILIFRRGVRQKETSSSFQEPGATVSVTNEEIEEESEPVELPEAQTEETETVDTASNVVIGPTLSNILAGNCEGRANEELEGAGLPGGSLAAGLTLNDIERNPVSLAGRLGEKPVVMIFGSFT